MSIIIYPPTIDWAWMKQRPQHLMSQLAKRGHRVFFCNKTQSRQPVEEIEPNLYLVHHHQEWLDRMQPVLRKYGGAVGVWCTLASHAPIVADYSPDWVVYDCVDEFAGWLRYEPDMIKKSTLIVCTSVRLYERLRRTYPNAHVELVRNAYDSSMKLHLSEPGTSDPCGENLSTNKKLVGYIGAWAPWVDELLVKRLSLQPGLEVIVIGPEYGKTYAPVSRSHNIRFLGLKPHHQLPGYIRRMSVCIIPFLITPVTLATNPVKAYEYLAAGKPVVSTNMPECRLMSPHVDIAASPEQFIETVIRRLNDPGDHNARIQFAVQNTWAQRGGQVDKLLTDVIRKQRTTLPMGIPFEEQFESN